jgi:hypothetical protein
MIAANLIDKLRSDGFTLRAVAGKINVRGARALTDGEREALRTIRDEVLQVLEAEGVNGSADSVNETRESVNDPQAFAAHLMTAQAFADETAGQDVTDHLGRPIQRYAPQGVDPSGVAIALHDPARVPLAPLSVEELRRIPDGGIRSRQAKTAARLGWLVERGLGASDEAQELVAERAWIDLHRPLGRICRHGLAGCRYCTGPP